MPLIKKKIYIIFLSFIFSFNPILAEEVKKIGKFKDWEAIVIVNDTETFCFAQSAPVLQSPKKKSSRSKIVCNL